MERSINEIHFLSICFHFVKLKNVRSLKKGALFMKNNLYPKKKKKQKDEELREQL